MSTDFDPALVTEFDVRDLLAAGHEPLRLIVERADALPPGGVLHVRSPFQPVPLFELMAARGFTWRSSEFGDQDWSSWFWRADHPPAPAREVAADPRQPAPDGVIDLRTLTPPEPLLWILRWVADAAPDQVLRVMLPFFPTPLPDLLAQAGWGVTTDLERADGVVVRIGGRVDG